MSNTLTKTITTQQLIELDYRYTYSDQELLADWNNLIRTTAFKTGSQFRPGIKLCHHFFPNFWTIENDKGMSFEKAWHDYEIMDRVRQWGLEGMSQLWLSWIRRAVYMVAGLPNSSFYRPHFSKQVTMMTNKTTGVLFDPCAGWGGRLLGTVANRWKYVGCEPNPETYNNLVRLVKFLGIESSVDLHNIPAELFDFGRLNDIDVVMTSPPYFNLEQYTTDKTQSYNQWTTYEQWLGQWLAPLITNTANRLAKDGISAWNVMNFKKYDLVGDVINIHNTLGLKLDSTVGFQSPLANIRKLKNKDVTYIFTQNGK